ncbi:hypothetical protein SFRURICE_015124 [Spodoptera frugiperda]|nr:hypothetical protein SFRURICE_015124 [Spodoptera frugiperda]
MLSTFYELLSDIIAQYVPKRRARLSEFPPWFDTALKKLLSEKNSKRLKYKKYKNPRDKLEYEILRSRCQKQLKTCYKEYVTRMEDNIAKNPKLLWNYVKNKRKGNLSLPGIMYSGVQREDNGPGIANLFASHFSSVYNSKLTFSSHINAAAKKGTRMLGFIKRNTKEFRLIRTKKILYNSLVLSHLEFASEVWSPIYAVQSQRIESVQRAFTRHLAYISSGISHRVPYYQRLNHFKMNTLNNRRKIHDILFLHKLLNGMADCNELVDNIKLTVPTRIPRYPISKPFHVPFCRTNVGKRSPLARFCGEYNSLCGSSDNLDIFHDPFNK